MTDGFSHAVPTALPDDRRARLLAIVEQEGAVRIAELAERLGVTTVTMRRDAAMLAEDGLVRRIHGGVARIDSARTGTEAGHATVGVVVPSLDYYWPDVVRGATAAARTAGLRLTVRGSTYDAGDLSDTLDGLVTRTRASGLILAPTLRSPATVRAVEQLVEAHLPVVLVERALTVGPLHEPVESVTTDHAQGAALGIRHLAALGHRRIGLATAQTSPTSAHVRRGWREAHAELGITAGTVDLDVPEPSEAGWEAAAAALLDECEATGTTALLVHADAAATALAQAAEDRGLHVPGDLSIIAYDDEVAGLVTPRLTAIRPPRRSLGRAAVELVAARIAEPRRPAHRVVVSPSLRVRDSTAPPRR